LKNAFLYFPLDVYGKSTSGVSQKCQSIIEAFKANGYTVDVMHESKADVYFNNKIIYELNGSVVSKKLRYYYNALTGNFKKLPSSVFEKKYQVCYYRLEDFLTISTFWFVKELLLINKGCKIYIELPNYPYYKQISKHWFLQTRLLLTKLLLFRLQKYVHKIITFSGDNFIWNIPTIKINNGFSPELLFSNINEKTSLETIPEFKKELQILGVANFNKYHGIDIVVNSLKAFRTTKAYIDGYRIRLHLVGDLSGLTSNSDFKKDVYLQDAIVFYGALAPREVATLANKIHLGLGAIAIHRKNIEINSAIKHRMYAFLGLPIMLRGNDLDFNDKLFFVYNDGQTEAPINFEAVLAFYENLVEKNKNYKQVIADYAATNLNWSQKLQPIFLDAEQ
jgi:glycosyltransferase involved in cell wall biosynthesis